MIVKDEIIIKTEKQRLKVLDAIRNNRIENKKSKVEPIKQQNSDRMTKDEAEFYGVLVIIFFLSCGIMFGMFTSGVFSHHEEVNNMNFTDISHLTTNTSLLLRKKNI